MTKRTGKKDQRYMDWIKTLPCAECGREADIEVHHPRGHKYGCGAGMKAPDCLAVPLCVDHHRAYHYGNLDDKATRQAGWVLDTLLLAIQCGLWTRSEP